MSWKKMAAFVVAAFSAVPAHAWDYREQDRPFTYLFVRIPLDGKSTKERLPVWGFAVRGKREYEVLRLDSDAMTRFVDLGFVESKVLLVGAVAAAGAIAVAATGSKSASTQQQQQQAAQQSQEQAAKISPNSATNTGPCVCPH